MRISDWSSDVCSSDLCDAHRIDAMFCILIQTTHGDIMPVIVPRLWVLVIQDVVSRVVLGYYLSFNKECNESDLLKCIQRALSSWRSEEHTSELQSLMRISYAVFCLKTKKRPLRTNQN